MSGRSGRESTHYTPPTMTADYGPKLPVNQRRAYSGYTYVSAIDSFQLAGRRRRLNYSSTTPYMGYGQIGLRHFSAFRRPPPPMPLYSYSSPLSSSFSYSNSR